MLTANIENKNVIEIDNNELKDMISSDQSFVLIIRLEGCSSCESFENDVLKPFVSRTHADIYSIAANEIDLMRDVDNKPKYQLAPNVQIYRNGESIYSEDYNEKKQYFKYVTAFEEFIKEYVVLPKIIHVSESYLDNMITNKENFILYIGWYRCGDCVALMDNVLKEYINEKNSNQFVYYLEVDEYRKNKPSKIPFIDPFDKNPNPDDVAGYENYMKWLEFAKKYNFADYEDGKVPTIQYYESGTLTEMIVYKNDTIVDEFIIKSYYKVLEGKTLSAEELDEFHKQKVIEFFDKYYK